MFYEYKIAQDGTSIISHAVVKDIVWFKVLKIMGYPSFLAVC
jgi:hypothetical protein